MANPYAGPATHGQAAARASPKGRPASLAGTTDCSQPVGATTIYNAMPTKGADCRAPAASPAASRGGSVSRKGGRPLAGWLPAGKGSRRMCRGSDGDNTEGKEGLGHHLEKRMILPL
ncbi:hypothetical protein BHE74_00058124 [Ensete ventricosum]|nr:hypothetical protein BHE74_00058124 [Ensete ventricosum]